MKSGIYKIINTLTNEFYIDSTININKRFTRHKWELNKNRHGNEILQRTVNKYGLTIFKFEIIEIIDNPTKELLILREQYYIDNLNPLYNIKKIADSALGLKRSDATRQRMSNAQKGRIVLEETRIKMSLAFKGKPRHTEKSKALIGKASKGNKHRLGTKHSEETKHKIRLSQLGKKASDKVIEELKSRAKKNKWPHGCQCKCLDCKIIRNNLQRKYRRNLECA